MAVKRSESYLALLQSVFEAIPNPVFYQDMQGRYLGCNAAFEKLFGFPKEEVIGKTIYELIPNALANIHYQRNKELFSTSSTQVYESKIVDAQGAKRDVIFYKAQLPLGEGLSGGLVGIIVDVTAQKQIEAELKDYQVGLEKRLNYAQAAIELSEIIAANEDQATILGGMAEVIGRYLNVDRAMIYDIDFQLNRSLSLSEWSHRKKRTLTNNQEWNLELFQATVAYAVENQSWVESHALHPNPLLVKDGLAELFHRKLQVRSLLFYPFAFRDQGFYSLVIHQTGYHRSWTTEEIQFLKNLSKQVEIALQKIQLLQQQQETNQLLGQQIVAMQASMDGIAVLDGENRYLYVNNAYARIRGYNDPRELLHRKWLNLYDQPERNRIIHEIFPEARVKGTWRGEVVAKRKDGTAFYQEISLAFISDDMKVSVVRDVTERKEVEKALWEQKEKALVTLRSIGDAVITTDEFGNVELLNFVAEDLTGWSLAAARGVPACQVFSIINEITGQSKRCPVVRSLEEDRIISVDYNTALIHKDGYQFAIESTAAPIKNMEGQIIGCVLVFRDVSEKRRLMQQITHQATYDTLTNLPNRVLFKDRLNFALAQARSNGQMLALLFLDLDRFKLINDLLGHTMGDELLKEVANSLRNILGESATVARLSGDEFTMIIPNISHAEAAAETAQKLLNLFKEPFHIEKSEFFVTASIGIAMYPTDGQNSSTLMKHADTAMHRAKENGGNKFQLFTSSMNQLIMQRMNLENSLRYALARDQFVLHYQPKINLATGEITGTEALVRWNHPLKGLVPPSEFIPLAEEIGLIIPLGEWILRTACRQNKIWQERGLNFGRVAVNLSAVQLKEPGFIELVVRVLEETGLPATGLEIEITEGIAMNDFEGISRILSQLKDMGIGIAVDDFGTGYSSLSYLKRFPVNVLKIDRSFISEIPGNGGDAAIAATIIVLARNLNLQVIAEGVEHHEQIVFLLEQGCNEAQGYFFSKPIEPEELERTARSKSWVN